MCKKKIMKNKLLTLLTVSALYSLAFSVYSFDYNSYKKSTLSGMLNDLADADCRPTKQNESIYSANIHKYRFEIKFTKKLRKINPDVQLYLERYAKAIPSRKDFIDLYKHAFLVKDSNKEYWLLVQEKLLPYMGNELKVGQEFEIYVVVLGSTKNQCVFLATEFQTTP